MVGEISTLYERPLTGARAKQVREVAVSAGGIIGNRLFVVYDASNAENLKRVSQQNIRDFAQLHAAVAANGRVRISHNRTDFDLGGYTINYDDDPNVTINEFDDPTPAIDMGNEAAASISNFANRDGLRLAQKTIAWHLGKGIHPKDRKNAPLHIVSTATMDYMNQKLGDIDKLAVTEDRLRPDILIESDEPLGEIKWQELRTESGVIIPITRMTERCNVPGNDQITGEKMIDVPRVYKHFPKSAKGKTQIGVYGYAEIEPGEKVVLKKGEAVEIISTS